MPFKIHVSLTEIEAVQCNAFAFVLDGYDFLSSVSMTHNLLFDYHIYESDYWLAAVTIGSSSTNDNKYILNPN